MTDNRTEKVVENTSVESTENRAEKVVENTSIESTEDRTEKVVENTSIESREKITENTSIVASESQTNISAERTENPVENVQVEQNATVTQVTRSEDVHRDRDVRAEDKQSVIEPTMELAAESKSDSPVVIDDVIEPETQHVTENQESKITAAVKKAKTDDVQTLAVPNEQSRNRPKRTDEYIITELEKMLENSLRSVLYPNEEPDQVQNSIPMKFMICFMGRGQLKSINF